MSQIKGTGIRCKYSEELKKRGNFEQLPKDINNYVKFKLIKPNDAFNYFLLLGYDNKEIGYAFPTIETLRIDNGGVSDTTVSSSLKRLQAAGLIRTQKDKTRNNKLLFYVDLPLNEEELLKQLPKQNHNVHENFKDKMTVKADNDKGRLRDALQRKEGLQQGI